MISLLSTRAGIGTLMFSNAMNFAGLDQRFFVPEIFFRRGEDQVAESDEGIEIVTERGFQRVREIDFEG
jgi:hypothetical protein